MSDRLEDLSVPPKLLAAIRNEVRSNTEQQLNDLWMVVHSLKDSVNQAAPSGEGGSVGGEALEEFKALLSALEEKYSSLLQQLEEQNKDLSKKYRALRKQLSEKSQEKPALPEGLAELPEQLQSLAERLEKSERETGQLGGAAALFESRLVDQENRILRRLDDTEARVARLATSPSSTPSAREGSDELSDEALLNLPGSVEFSLEDLAKVAVKYNASDIIVQPNSFPYTYLEGDLTPIGDKKITPTDAYRVTLMALHHSERQQLMQEKSFTKLVQYHNARFVLNAYFERGQLATYARRLAPPPLSLDQLDLPRALEVSLLEEGGLILLCGVGQGNLKALAYALLHHINNQRRVRIFTLEGAINYELPQGLALPIQLHRSIDVASSRDLLRLRPDVLFLERMSDLQDLNVALQLASDRTLVIATCSGSGVISSLQQLVGLCAPENGAAIMAEMAGALRSVLCYRESQNNEYLINSSKVRPWLERGDFAALETAVESGQPTRSKPAAAAPAPTREAPLPPPSTETLAPARLTAAPPPSTPAPQVAKTEPATTKLQPPPKIEEEEGGDDEMMLGWL